MAVTVLIVDDNAQFRVFLREVAAEVSDLHVVGEAADGAEAMRLAQELRPEFLLLDFVMPRGNGLEVLQWIKAERPEIKVISLPFWILQPDRFGWLVRKERLLREQQEVYSVSKV
jgi:DNA-binding NarL/FixJ family response regulator